MDKIFDKKEDKNYVDSQHSTAQHSTAQHNGEIDICRYLFAVIIMINHLCLDYHKGVMARGYIGVEFFFLVTGYLMACSAKRTTANSATEIKKNIPNLTWTFVFRKICSFYPYYIVALLIKYISVYCVISYKGKKEFILTLLKSIPTLTLTIFPWDISGLGLSINGCWYLSAMLIAIFILYPLLINNYQVMSKLAFPILASFLLGYLNVKYKKCFGTHNVYDGIIYSGCIRAIGEISFGVSLKALVDKINEYKYLNSHLVFLTIAKYLSLITILIYTTNILNTVLDLHIFLICAIFITLSFSNATYSLPGNKITNFLGKQSLILYIYAGLCRNILNALIKKGTYFSLKKILFIVIITIITSVIFGFITDMITKLLKRIIKKPQRIVN